MRNRSADDALCRSSTPKYEDGAREIGRLAGQGAPKLSGPVSDEIKRLLWAQNCIERKSAQREEGVETIASLMRAYHPGSDWSRAHYGAMAVRASFADGDVEKAKSILGLAFQSDPQDEQLLYLARILIRAETGPAAGSKPIKLSAK